MYRISRLKYEETTATVSQKMDFKSGSSICFISFGLAFLIPILGWNPLLLLWIVNGCLSYKEAKSNSIKIFNAVLVLLFGVLFIINLFLGFLALMQYFGYFI